MSCHLEDRQSLLVACDAHHVHVFRSFDLWWLVGSIWIICICERGKLRNEDNFDYFNLFSVIFEMVSAFAGVGLSLGLPYNNVGKASFAK